MPWPLYPQGKSPWCLLDRRLGGPQSQSGHGGEEKNSQPLLGLEHLIIQLIAQRYTTELFWLPGFIYIWLERYDRIIMNDKSERHKGGMVMS
jgi:hypothetical protein